MIPFSSEIKFNMILRDMNTAERKPTKAEDNLTIYLKGAPDKVWCRCSKIRVNGEDVDFNDQAL